MMNKHKDSISDEDKALFRAYVRDLNPLDKEGGRPLESLKTHQLSDYIQEPVFAETCLSYGLQGLHPKQLKSLKNGQGVCEARLDLHGFTIDKAREALMGFIQHQALQQKRTLLIIHGKGGYKGEPPLIKNLVHRWLPQLPEVLAYHSARPRDGGTGAVYVLLKTACVRGTS